MTGRPSALPRILLMTAALVVMLGMGRPEAMLTWLAPRAVVILALDISGSMLAEDVPPTRMAAAQAAATEFIAAQPADVMIGIVAFAETASLVQPPTRDRDALRDALARFEPQPGTAVGDGLLQSLRAIDPELPRGDKAAIQPPGSNRSAIVVLMTDGQTTNGPDPIEAARVAADQGVRVYTVGFGSKAGSVVEVGQRYVAVSIDEPTLMRVADITRGRYFYAATSEQLREVYAALTSEFLAERGRVELTAVFAAAAALLMIIGAGLSVAWTGRIL